MDYGYQGQKPMVDMSNSGGNTSNYNKLWREAAAGEFDSRATEKSKVTDYSQDEASGMTLRNKINPSV